MKQHIKLISLCLCVICALSLAGCGKETLLISTGGSTPLLCLEGVPDLPVAPQDDPTLCDPGDGSPPGSPVPGILQARTLEWVAISFSNA